MKKKPVHVPDQTHQPPPNGVRFPLGDVRSKDEFLVSLRRNYRLTDSSAAKLNLPSDLFIQELSDGSSFASVFSSSRISISLSLLNQMTIETVTFPHYFIAFYGNSSSRYFIFNDPSRNIHRCVRLAGINVDLPNLDLALSNI